MADIGVITKMVGVAVHDGWKPYRSYDVVHALCNECHLRERAVNERFDQGWAKELIDLLLDAKEAVEQAIERDGKRLSPAASRSIWERITATRVPTATPGRSSSPPNSSALRGAGVRTRCGCGRRSRPSPSGGTDGLGASRRAAPRSQAGTPGDCWASVALNRP